MYACESNKLNKLEMVRVLLRNNASVGFVNLVCEFNVSFQSLSCNCYIVKCFLSPLGWSECPPRGL